MKKDYKKNNEDNALRINKTATIGELLNISRFSDGINSSKIDLITKHSTIFSFWGDIVGKKFTTFVKPVSIKASKLYVSAKSPVIIQELELYKSKLLKKINSYSRPLGIEIKDIVFNYKNFNETQNQKDETLVEDKPLMFDEKLINSIVLDDNTIQKIKESVSKISFLDKEKKEKLLNKIIFSKKAELIRARKHVF